MPRALAELTAAELAVFRRRLDAPDKIQRFLDEIPYNIEAEGETFRSPRRVLADRTANCIEGAVLAAAALRVQGQLPLIMDLTATRDEDHVIAVFRRRGLWGAIGSRSTGRCANWRCPTSSSISTWRGSAHCADTAARSTWPASIGCGG